MIPHCWVTDEACLSQRLTVPVPEVLRCGLPGLAAVHWTPQQCARPSRARINLICYRLKWCMWFSTLCIWGLLSMLRLMCRLWSSNSKSTVRAFSSCLHASRIFTERLVSLKNCTWMRFGRVTKVKKQYFLEYVDGFSNILFLRDTKLLLLAFFAKCET